jgi:mycothiol synthase
VIVRRPREADAAAVTDLIRTVEAGMVGRPEQSAEDLGREWSSLDLSRDAWLVELDGRPAGYAALYTEGHPLGDGYVHPNARGRGVGSRLVDLVEAAARERGLETLQIPVFGNDEPAHELLRSRGFRDVRRYYRMEIELEEAPPAPAWPSRLAAGPLDPADGAAFHEALDEAFAQEWGHEPERGVDWRNIRERRSADRSLWFAVKDGSEIAAAAITEEDRWGAAWIASIGVRERWRRRGLGLALLGHCFRELYARGKHKIALGVDAENPTGATRLYERAGMHVAYSAVYFEKELTT